MHKSWMLLASRVVNTFHCEWGKRGNRDIASARKFGASDHCLDQIRSAIMKTIHFSSSLVPYHLDQVRILMGSRLVDHRCNSTGHGLPVAVPPLIEQPT